MIDKKSSLKTLFKANRVFFNYVFAKGKHLLLLDIFYLILGIPITIIQLYAPKNFLDELIDNASIMDSLIWIILMTISFLLYFAIGNFITSYRHYFLSNATFAIKDRIIHRYTQLYLSYFDYPDKLNNAQRALDYSDYGGVSLYDFLISSLSMGISFGTMTFISMKFDWWLWILILGNFIIRYFIGKRIKKIEYSFNKEKVIRDRMENYFKSVPTEKNNLEEMKIYKGTNFFIEKYQSILKKNRIIQLKYDIKSMLFNLLQILPDQGLMIVAYAVIGYRILSKESTIGDYALFISMISQISTLLINLSNIITSAYEQILNAQNLIEFEEDSTHLMSNLLREPNITEPVENIEFDNVSFRYPGQNNFAVHNLSLKIKKGEKITIVGYNGAGKTTFIKLLMQLYRPDSGSIFINGVSTDNYDYNCYWDKLGLVSQNYNCYSISIGENIFLSDMVENQRQVAWDALEKVGLSSKVKKIEKKLDAQLTRNFYSDGIDFSTGERQKLSIARAFAKNSDIYIMDEPSSALDPLSEEELYQQIKLIPNDKTLIFISHRLSSVIESDRVLFFKDGVIIGDGRHEDLLKSCNEYKKLFELQASRYNISNNSK